MPDFILTRAEFELLACCSGLAVKVYLVLRSRMDFATGKVGIKTWLSYQGLLEWTEEEIERGSGRQKIQASLRSVRTALEQLVRRGLLRRLSTENLAFLCVLAPCDKSRPNQTRQKPGRGSDKEHGTEPGTDNASVGAGLAHEHGTEPDRILAGVPPPNPSHIRYPINTSTSLSSSTTVNGVGSDDGLSDAFGLAERWRGSPEGPSAGMAKVIELVAWLRKKGVQLQAADPRVIAWVTDAVPEDVLARAVDRCRDSRGPSPQPIKAGYLDVVARDLWAQSQRPARKDWRTAADADLERRATELGLHTVGKSRADVVAAIVARERGEAA